MALAFSIPILYYNCDWSNAPHFKQFHFFLMVFHIALPILIYLIATVLCLIGFARRIRGYGLENRSYFRTFMKLFYRHLFIFVPLIVYTICYGSYNLVAAVAKPENGYFHCKISLAEYIVKVLLRSCVGLPFTITWLLFVYPSRVYMVEFYMNTWSGQWTAFIVLRFRRFWSNRND
ncbi:unnamed protein product [Adineta ricciae]|uniref:Uncharacterized protein n=1 Tax=Adineta ricciae TaxID=249248 RepID=A0A815BT58_ADIRI|nr:unnamed protein product [Adineta ricciae]CAF1568857.1 unnamed protein product [Adineta ricciae]